MAGWNTVFALFLVCLTVCSLLQNTDAHVPVGRSLADKRFKFLRNLQYANAGDSWGEEKRMFDSKEFPRQRSYDDAPYDSGRCPKIGMVLPPCKNTCKTDWHCCGSKKCCPLEDCKICLKAVHGPPPEPCPTNDSIPIICDALFCQTTTDCRNGKICCINECGSHVCYPPDYQRISPP